MRGSVMGRSIVVDGVHVTTVEPLIVDPPR